MSDLIKENSLSKEMEERHEDRIVPNAGWKKLPIGGVIPTGGTAGAFETGDWRTKRPIFLEDRCINCHRCWLWCPDFAVISEGGKVLGFDYKYCKGCGVCANVCPAKVHAIEMRPENDPGDITQEKEKDEK